ncbi:ribonuclease H-like domain-containing protein [Candidatus Woesearchaeota archaeon]|nr:ribonuclease H-like domain-containing protein [Candidatus Woesearchaeota archaeon]
MEQEIYLDKPLTTSFGGMIRYRDFFELVGWALDKSHPFSFKRCKVTSKWLSFNLRSFSASSNSKEREPNFFQRMAYFFNCWFESDFIFIVTTQIHYQNSKVYILFSTPIHYRNCNVFGEDENMQRTDIITDIETTGFDPLKDGTTALGIATAECELIFIDNDERVNLHNYWQFLRKHQYFRLIGFEICFDVRFLVIRSLLHKIKIVDIVGKTVDLRQILSFGNKYLKGTLNDYTKFLGLGEKYNGFIGANATLLWQEGKTDELKKYLSKDLDLTFKLYDRCKHVGLL